MKIRPLILDDGARALIKLACDSAFKNRIDIAGMRAIIKSQKAPGDDERYHAQKIEIPIGYRVFFTIEEHPMGWARHISISVKTDNPKLCPSPEAVSMIMKEYGFVHAINEGSPTDKAVYPEYGEAAAINVIEKIPDLN